MTRKIVFYILLLHNEYDSKVRRLEGIIIRIIAIHKIMITYLLDEMADNYKILIFYVLRKITEPEIRKNIWNQIQEYKNLVLTEIINQECSEELDELERVYNYDYTNIWDSELETD